MSRFISMADLKFQPHIFTTLVVVLSLGRITHSLSCYECHGRERQNSADPSYQIVKRSKALEADNVNCSREKDQCTGTACVIYDNFNDSTTGNHFFSAFCLYDRLTPLLVATSKGGCWMDEEGKGRHCVCMEDFCNVPPRLLPGEVAIPIISQQLRLLERNPLIDYDYIEDEQHLSKEDTPLRGSGKGEHALAEIDLDKLDVQQMDDGRGDLTPVNFKDYQQWESDGQNESEVMTNGAMPHQTTTAGVVYETSPQQGLVALNSSALPAETIDASRVHPPRASGDEGSRSGASPQHHAGYPIQALSAFIVVSFLVHLEKWVLVSGALL